MTKEMAVEMCRNMSLHGWARGIAAKNLGRNQRKKILERLSRWNDIPLSELRRMTVHPAIRSRSFMDFSCSKAKIHRIVAHPFRRKG